MNIMEIKSHEIYRKMMNSKEEKRADIFRYEMMKPFEEKWRIMNVPLKAPYEGGYDVVMAAEMLGYLSPKKVDDNCRKYIDMLGDDTLWKTCRETISGSLKRFTDKGYELGVKDYRFTIMIANSESPYTKLNQGVCGDGGIPGHIFISLVPSRDTVRKVPSVLAHECNHNVRFQFQEWKANITLGEMMIAEGIAENFATSMFGEDTVGPWVSSTDKETLDRIKPIIKKGLDVQGFDNITAYLFGDEIAELRGFIPVGLPYCAGYACGYHMVKYYLEKTGRSIEEATITSAKEIMDEIQEFWN